MEIKEMIRGAKKASETSYAPYSGFHVGAYLETGSGNYYSGCNIENSSYGATNCAERTAFFKAVSEGETVFTRIAIVGGREGSDWEVCPPCGICLQVMMEFCNPKTFEIILGTEANPEIYHLEDLLPKGFGPGNLHKDNAE